MVVLADGTKYVSSVRQGTVARIRPGQKAEIIASGIPSAASMTYDSKRNRLRDPDERLERDHDRRARPGNAAQVS